VGVEQLLAVDLHAVRDADEADVAAWGRPREFGLALAALKFVGERAPCVSGEAERSAVAVGRVPYGYAFGRRDFDARTAVGAAV
jgi:hypothetical protein